MHRHIILDKHTLHVICNALNAQAAAFEAHAENAQFGSSRSVFEIKAKDNRSLTKNLLDQWENNQ